MTDDQRVQPFEDRLRVMAEELRERASQGATPAVREPIERLEEAAETIARAWSGSSFGYHSRVYYEGLRPPPPGAHFSSEWGFLGTFQGTTGHWQEYPYDEVLEHIRRQAGDPDLTEAEAVSDDARRAFDDAHSEVISILSAFLAERNDEYIATLKAQAEKILALTKTQGIRAQLPTGGTFMSRDTLALTQGLQTAPHQEVYAEVAAIRSPFTACADLATIADRSAAHIERVLARPSRSVRAQGNNVFMGHGRSLAWRELKDFLQDRLLLSWDEFNRVPVAGVTNIARLAQMLDDAGIAFLVLTAEDERADGAITARQNVIHEAGLFQGRLGFTRAIVLLEEGCEEFSNIAGLGQIRFPPGRISAAFEEVRRVLEREGFLNT